MPEIRRYTVTQTRQVRVAAENAAGAAKAAQDRFEGKTDDPYNRIQEIGLEVKL